MRAVLRVLVEHRISGAPVVDAAGRPVGMVSITDLLREQYDELEDAEDELPLHPARRAEEIMTPSVFSIREDASVGDAAREMAKRHVHRVPVVTREGVVVGMVSALDVVRWMAPS